MERTKLTRRDFITGSFEPNGTSNNLREHSQILECDYGFPPSIINHPYVHSSIYIGGGKENTNQIAKDIISRKGNSGQPVIIARDGSYMNTLDYHLDAKSVGGDDLVSLVAQEGVSVRVMLADTSFPSQLDEAIGKLVLAGGVVIVAAGLVVYRAADTVKGAVQKKYSKREVLIGAGSTALLAGSVGKFIKDRNRFQEENIEHHQTSCEPLPRDPDNESELRMAVRNAGLIKKCQHAGRILSTQEQHLVLGADHYQPEVVEMTKKFLLNEGEFLDEMDVVIKEEAQHLVNFHKKREHKSVERMAKLLDDMCSYAVLGVDTEQDKFVPDKTLVDHLERYIFRDRSFFPRQVRRVYDNSESLGVERYDDLFEHAAEEIIANATDKAPNSNLRI